MADEAVVRPACLGDGQAVLDCFNCAVQLHKPQERPVSDLATFEELIRTEKVLLYEKEGVVWGWVSYSLRGNYLFISGLYVRQEAQQRGIGQRLLNWVFDEARNQGTAHCVLKVSRNAPWALAFYKKNGFVPLDLFSKDIAQDSSGTAGSGQPLVLYRALVE